MIPTGWVWALIALALIIGIAVAIIGPPRIPPAVQTIIWIIIGIIALIIVLSLLGIL